MKIIYKIIISISLFLLGSQTIVYADEYRVVFTCTDPYNAGRESGMAELLMQNFARDDLTAYSHLITSSGVSEICSPMLTPTNATNPDVINNIKILSSDGSKSFAVSQWTKNTAVGLVIFKKKTK
jgi:hypothetical protein